MTREYWPTYYWKISSPEEQGVNSDFIYNLFKQVIITKANLQSILVFKNRYLIAEGYFHPFNKGFNHQIHSITKSFTATLIGITLKEKILKNINQKVLDFFPKKKIKNLSAWKKDLTIKDLLTNTTGFEWGDVINAEAASDLEIIFEMILTDDWAQFCLDRKILKKPGTFFTSNSPGPQLLACIIKKVTGMSPHRFAKEKLFNPLGIKNTRWFSSLTDNNTGAQGLSMKPVDIAKLGLLYLSNGIWDYVEILPENWINESTSVQCQTRKSHKQDHLAGYGYQWFIASNLPFYTYCIYGVNGQFIFVVKELNLIFVTTGNIPNNQYKLLIYSYLKDYVIPACNKENKPLRPNRDSYKKLLNIIYDIENPKFDNYSNIPAIVKKNTSLKYYFSIENTFIFLENIRNCFLVKSILFNFINNKICQVIIETYCNNYFNLSVSLSNIYKINYCNTNLGRFIISARGKCENNAFIIEYITDFGIRNTLQMLSSEKNKYIICNVDNFLFKGNVKGKREAIKDDK